MHFSVRRYVYGFVNMWMRFSNFLSTHGWTSVFTLVIPAAAAAVADDDDDDDDDEEEEDDMMIMRIAILKYNRWLDLYLSDIDDDHDDSDDPHHMFIVGN